MVEADGRLMHGGVFMASKSANLLNATPENVRPKLLQKFGTWNDGKDNLAKRVPYVTNKCGIYLTTSSSVS